MSNMTKYCRALPKVELHAHLNGSLSSDTIHRLCGLKQNAALSPQEFHTIQSGSDRTLDECFDMFTIVRQLTNNVESLYLATVDIIHEFAEDNVKYLELRSTIREEAATGMSKTHYIDAVLRAIEDCKTSDPGIIVKYLASIDRSKGAAEAMENVSLVTKYVNVNGAVVGVDLSGNPARGIAADFVPALREAQKCGLKLSIHLSESQESNVDTHAFLQLIPDRIGHGTFLLARDGGDERFEQLVTTHQIPLELCLTSNVKSRTVSAADTHHFKHWYSKNHPLTLGTDDKGIFSTTLSQEYELAARTFNLDKKQLFDLSKQAVDYAFAIREDKEKLLSQWEKIDISSM